MMIIMMHKKKSTHFVAIVLAIVLAAIIGNFFVIGFVQQQIQNNILKEAAQGQQITAMRTGAILKSEIENTQAELVLVSNYNDIRSGDADACNKKLEEVSSSYNPQIFNFVRMDVNGTGYCNVNKSAIEMNSINRPHIRKIIMEDPKHEPILSRLVRSPVNQKWSVALYVPVYSQDENFNGILGRAMYIENFANEFLKNITASKDSRISIVDDNGDFIYYTQPELIGRNLFSDEVKAAFGKSAPAVYERIKTDMVAGKSGYIVSDFQGIERLASYSSLEIFPNRTWSVLVSAPTASILKENSGANTFTYLYMVSSVIVIAGAVMILLIMERSMRFTLKRIGREFEEAYEK